MGTPRPYKISVLSGEPAFDSLPVAKIIDYPLEKRDYRPFAQCVLCVGGDRVYLRMWAFEVSVPPSSSLGCVLYLYPDHPERAVLFELEHNGRDDVAVGVELLENGRVTAVEPDFTQEERDSLLLHPHNGEDLQGVYWGMNLSLPLSVLERMGGPVALRAGQVFPGNFFKTCRDGRFGHMGSYFPAGFPDHPYAPESMGEFQVVAY